jgi:glycosyltransferase involved in cell wall biosynthesis
MRVLRVYHGGRDPSHRARERALLACGVEITLVVPAGWPTDGVAHDVSGEDFKIVELKIRREGDINRHAYADRRELSRLVRKLDPDVLDIHEEPFSLAARQWLAAAPPGLPVVMYTAQNIDKRYPPPFAQYERSAHRRVSALYPCSRQAASVARGKGFTGRIEVLPLGFDESVVRPGSQSLDDGELILGLFGRLVPEKGAMDAVRLLVRLNAVRSARLVLMGSGPDGHRALKLASDLGVSDRVEVECWATGDDLATMYRRCHVVLVPSKPTATWVEQFGRVIVEAQASGAVVAGYASGSIPEVAGDAAVLSSVGDVDALAAELAAILTDPYAFGRLREAGERLARDRTWQRVAAGQVALYRDLVTGEDAPLRLPRSPAARRAVARAEFGPPAATLAGERPFALPVLRQGGVAASALAMVLDLGAEAHARLGR